MRVSLRKREQGQVEFGLLYGGILLFGLLAARYLPLPRLLPACFFKFATGMPCPTCGLTRATVALSRGDLMTSISMNPLLSALMISVILYGAYCAVTYVLPLRRLRIAFDEREGNMIRFTAVLLFALNWIYLCRVL